MDLPEVLKGQGGLYMIGETEDGELCIVSVMGFALCIWFRRAGADGVEKWMVDSVISLESEILQATESSSDDCGELKLNVWAVLDGIVYLSPWTLSAHGDPVWFLSFCLKTTKLHKLFNEIFDNCMYPYIMSWPPSLVRNTP
ncbi:hypothetical protein PR202_gb29212 [Eleusine coracana subsp. coracana]|uniref:F-box protein AT5G49610-like beta-propeller domain-containing protein n=1 Tax=Eleusine coracana subsp. coracana TaxID=191504 RepID=A0AAV5FZQ7_ELECO|nr:hypothetical protein PR202_gb29212 [Eleusine coracana subsp. coracana]